MVPIGIATRTIICVLLTSHLQQVPYNDDDDDDDVLTIIIIIIIVPFLNGLGVHLAGLRWHTPWCYQPCGKFRRCGPTSSCQRFRTFSRQLGRGIQPQKDQLRSGDLRLWGQLLPLHQLLASCGGTCTPVRKVLWKTWSGNGVSSHSNPTNYFWHILSLFGLLWTHLKPSTEPPHQEVMDKSEADELRQNVLGPALSLPTVEVEIIARARWNGPGLKWAHQKWHLDHSLQLGMDQYLLIPFNTIFRGMNIHLPAILMFTRGTRFWHTASWTLGTWLGQVDRWLPEEVENAGPGWTAWSLSSGSWAGFSVESPADGRSTAPSAPRRQLKEWGLQVILGCGSGTIFGSRFCHVCCLCHSFLGSRSSH